MMDQPNQIKLEISLVVFVLLEDKKEQMNKRGGGGRDSKRGSVGTVEDVRRERGWCSCRQSMMVEISCFGDC